MLRIAKHFLVLLAVLAVGAAQVFGIARGFICECTGEPVHVESASCDAECHPDGDHHDDDEDSDGGPRDQHRHKEATESIKLVPLAPLTFDSPAAVEVDVSAIIALGVRLSNEEAEHRAELKPPDDTGGSLPAGVLVARTMVMLV